MKKRNNNKITIIISEGMKNESTKNNETKQRDENKR